MEGSWGSNWSHADVETDGNARLILAAWLYLMPEPGWEEQQLPNLGQPPHPALAILTSTCSQGWHQHLGPSPGIQKSNRAGTLGHLQIDHAAEQTVRVKMGPGAVALPIHHRPSVIEGWRCLG